MPKLNVNVLMWALDCATTGDYGVGKWPKSRMCFVCRVDTPIGPKLKYDTVEVGRYITQFRPHEEQQGFPGQPHGGTLSTLLGVPTQICVRPCILAVCFFMTDPWRNKKQRA